MSEAKYRMLPDDINDWYVRGSDGQMVPFSAFSSSRWEYGSPRLERYNGLPRWKFWVRRRQARVPVKRWR